MSLSRGRHVSDKIPRKNGLGLSIKRSLGLWAGVVVQHSCEHVGQRLALNR